MDGDGDLDAWLANFGEANRVWLDVDTVLAPEIFVSPVSHDFGTVTVGLDSPEQPFTVTNTGSTDLVPDLRANGKDDILYVAPWDPVKITASLDAAGQAAHPAEWWIGILYNNTLYPLYRKTQPVMDLPPTTIWTSRPPSSRAVSGVMAMIRGVVSLGS